MMTTERRKLTEPLQGVPRSSAACAARLVNQVIVALAGSGSLWGFGHAPICATQPGSYGSGDWGTAQLGVTARPGASLARTALFRRYSRPG